MQYATELDTKKTGPRFLMTGPGFDIWEFYYRYFFALIAACAAASLAIGTLKGEHDT